MKAWLPFLIPITLGLGPAAPAQEPVVPPPLRETEAGKPADDLVADLGNENFRVRIQAEQKLRAMGKEALPALRKAADGSGDPEVQWRARRLIRQIERGEEGGLGRRPAREERDLEPMDQRRMPFEDMQRRFDDLFQQLERDFGMDIPRRRFFRDDFFQDLQSQMQDMEERMRRWQGGMGQAPGQSMSVQIGPDGVRVEQRVKNERGEEERKVYEAPDLKTFREKYPGVLEESGLGGTRLFWGATPDLRLQPFAPQEPLRPLRLRQQEPAAEAPPEGRRLGVVVRPEIAPELREYLGLREGEGLMVEEVQPDTLAQTLGIEPRDIVLRIGDRAIAGTEDVQRALGEIAGGGKVEVTVLRSGQRKVLTATKPAEKVRRSGLEKRGESIR